MDVTE